jgi:hypothetical protein
MGHAEYRREPRRKRCLAGSSVAYDRYAPHSWP